MRRAHRPERAVPRAATPLGARAGNPLDRDQQAGNLNRLVRWVRFTEHTDANAFTSGADDDTDSPRAGCHAYERGPDTDSDSDSDASRDRHPGPHAML